MAPYDVEQEGYPEAAFEHHPEIWRALPAWFMQRMMDDVWRCGLLLTTGVILAVESIDDLTQDVAGDLWIDVDLIPQETAYDLGARVSKPYRAFPILGAPTSRTRATVRVAHIVAAFELADT
jgi:hypothetical protein